MQQGQMDTTAAKCLVNSIYRFVHLVSCSSIKLTQIQKNYDRVAGVLKHLKTVIDEVIDYRFPYDENLSKECEELDMAVNEAREFAEHWSQKRSKIHSLMRNGQLLNRVRNSSLEICHVLYKSLESSLSPGLSDVQNCMQEINCLKLEQLTVDIEESLRSQRENVESHEHIIKIIEPLGFTTNKELLKENIALEKERLKAELNKMKGELDDIDQILALLSNIRNYRMRSGCSEISTSISIPAYFRCPLSLELMLDPVIVASGQTYDRTSIQEWLDHGLNICPKTRQKLTHTNLIPNYTVKAMVADWCEENCVRVSSKSEQMIFDCVTSSLDQLPKQELFRTLSIKSSLSGSNSTSRSSFQAGNGFENQRDDMVSRMSDLSNRYPNGARENFEQPSPAPSFVHSRSASLSSLVSSTGYGIRASNEVAKASTRCQNEFSGEITSESFHSSPPTNDANDSPLMSGKQRQVPGKEVNVFENENNSHSRAQSLLMKTCSDVLTSTLHVKKLIEDLNSQSNDVQTIAAEELRLLAKHNMENRIIIGQCGAITALLPLLYSNVKLTQEHAVTALLNLSISEDNKALIVEAGAIEAFIYVLKTGSNGAKENSAAALYSLSALEKYKDKIGRSGAIKVLVDLLSSGTLRGKKDAATALFNLSIFHENKARIVQAGAVKYLVQLLDPATGMVDKAVALLANLSSIGEGRLAIAHEEGIPLLVEIVESGSLRGKENAASVLLQLCLYSPKHCTLVLQEGAVPPLVALSQSGTPRARDKAQQLLSHFRNQREGAIGKGKSA